MPLFQKKKVVTSFEKKIKILIADDEIDIRTVLEKGLTAAGYDVIVAFDGEEALAKIKDEKPDLAVLDINMPKIDGIEVLQKVKRNPETNKLPVIMLTVDQDLLKGYKYGADYYITKPFKINMVLTGVRMFFQYRQEQAKKYEVHH